MSPINQSIKRAKARMQQDIDEQAQRDFVLR